MANTFAGAARRHGRRAVTGRALLLSALLVASGRGFAASPEDLVRAYPEALSKFDGTNLVWRDGTLMPFGQVHVGQDEALARASVADQLAAHYPADAPSPPTDDPGRARNEAFFDKMYGDCRVGEVSHRLVRVVWLPRNSGRAVSVTSVNGVNRALEAVSDELDNLPAEYQKFLYPIGGTYNCRRVAGTEQRSMHSWGAAIDLNPAYADYWRWKRSWGGADTYANRIPQRIVAVFERHGFIWGGRWSHYDTMHFEYRPELLPLHGTPD